MDNLRDILANNYILRCKIRGDLTGKFSDEIYRLFKVKTGDTDMWWLPREDALKAGLQLRGREENSRMVGKFPGEDKKGIETPIDIQINSSIEPLPIMVVDGDMLSKKGYAIYKDLVSKNKVPTEEGITVAIEVDSEKYYVCKNDDEVLEWKEKNFPEKELYLYTIDSRLYERVRRLNYYD